jgi:hypothetical protein
MEIVQEQKLADMMAHGLLVTLMARAAQEHAILIGATMIQQNIMITLNLLAEHVLLDFALVQVAYPLHQHAVMAVTMLQDVKKQFALRIMVRIMVRVLKVLLEHTMLVTH